MRKPTQGAVLLKKQRVSAIKRQRGFRKSSLIALLKQNSAANVCIIRSVGGLGDILMATPLLRELKRKFPDMKLTFGIDRHSTHEDVYFNLVKNAPFIDSIAEARYIDRSAYDAVADISAACIRYENSGGPPINRIDLFASSVGLGHMANKLPFYKVEPEERALAQRMLSSYRKQGLSIVLYHSASNEGKRSWPAKHSHSLFKLAEEQNLPIVFCVLDHSKILGNLKSFSNCVSMSHLSFRQTAALIQQADLFVGPDSGPMHLAGAVKTPSLVLFGSIPPEARINYYPTHTAIRTGEHCSPCWYKACPYQIKCMNNISPELVLDRMMNVLTR